MVRRMSTCGKNKAPCTDCQQTSIAALAAQQVGAPTCPCFVCTECWLQELIRWREAFCCNWSEVDTLQTTWPPRPWCCLWGCWIRCHRCRYRGPRSPRVHCSGGTAASGASRVRADAAGTKGNPSGRWWKWQGTQRILRELGMVWVWWIFQRFLLPTVCCVF